MLCCVVFKYKPGKDSVLLVTEAAYKSCDVTNPIQSYTDGNSVFKFDRSGPFFFISGADDHCKRGQRLIVVVLAIRPASSASGLAVSGVYLGAMAAMALLI
ncbi:hypothetical protein GW17_00015946 [Ensete ventricosum]|nr:hypothetical protein GW17_00015946 [Ensete ventricosum]